MLIAVFGLLHHLAVHNVRVNFLIYVCQLLILLDSRELLAFRVIEVVVFHNLLILISIDLKAKIFSSKGN